MAVGDNRHYRVKGIQPHHFYQTARQAGIGKPDMDEMFADIAARTHAAIEQAAALAARTGMPDKTAATILAGVGKRAALIDVG